MPSEPDNRKIEELLKAYGKKRQEDVGAPLDLHPATRKMLQGEVAKLRPSGAPEKSGLLPLLLRFWPRFAVFGGRAGFADTETNLQRFIRIDIELQTGTGVDRRVWQ